MVCGSSSTVWAFKGWKNSIKQNQLSEKEDADYPPD
jgi:hypothetical protein